MLWLVESVSWLTPLWQYILKRADMNTSMCAQAHACAHSVPRTCTYRKCMPADSLLRYVKISIHNWFSGKNMTGKSFKTEDHQTNLILITELAESSPPSTFTNDGLEGTPKLSHSKAFLGFQEQSQHAALMMWQHSERPEENQQEKNSVKVWTASSKFGFTRSISGGRLCVEPQSTG